MKRTVTVLLLLMAVVGMPLAKTKKVGISVTLDESALKGRPEGVTSAWIGYGTARAQWLGAHVLGKPQPAGGYRRSFEEELAGRESLAKVWTELKQSDATLKDAYLDDLATVAKAGFMREYVWTLLKSADWQATPDGLRLDEFGKWKATALAQHKVETLAEVVIPAS